MFFKACSFCSNKSCNSSISNYIIGFCVQCNSNPMCTVSFHPECGQREGVVFYLGEQSTMFRIACKNCYKNRRIIENIANKTNGLTNNNQNQNQNAGNTRNNNNVSQPLKNGDEIEVNSIVIAKYQSVYSYARVLAKSEEVFHRVLFVDNSLVTNLRSCDILVSFEIVSIFLSLTKKC